MVDGIKLDEYEPKYNLTGDIKLNLMIKERKKNHGFILILKKS